MIRLATTNDADAVLAIYAPVVRDTAISFEYHVPTAADMEARIANVLLQRPWLVYEWKGEVLGYVYASTFRDRLAYQWGTEVTVYIRADVRGRGLGRALYTALFEVLKLQGFCTVVAGATLPNAATERLHERMGFRLIGVYPAAGYKLGRWHDVVFWYLHLQPNPAQPQEPLRLRQVVNTKAWDAALRFGAELVNL
jgi:phosphinothricin acetyltransferase